MSFVRLPSYGVTTDDIKDGDQDDITDEVQLDADGKQDDIKDDTQLDADGKDEGEQSP